MGSFQGDAEWLILTWFLSARAAKVLTRLAVIACFLGSLTSAAIVILLALNRHPSPQLFPLYPLPIVTLVFGQLTVLGWAAARSSASEGRAYSRSMRFGSGGDFFRNIFGPVMPRRLTALFMMLFYLAIACTASCMWIGNASGHPVAAERSCAYPSNDHGTVVCLSAFEAAAVQGIAPAVFFGFNIIQAGSALGGVLQQRSSGLEQRRGAASDPA